MRYFFFLFLFVLRVNACDCENPNPVLEFYNAEYVFEGVIALKVYNDDFETYSIAFNIYKHYKHSSNPKVLRFELTSEELYNDKLNSCDWSVNIDEKWLVYAHRSSDGTLKFNYYCSNSKKIDFSIITDDEQKVLDNGNDFIIDDYIYNLEPGFTHPKPIINVDSLLKQAKSKDYKKTFIVVKAIIDKKGNLQGVISNNNYSAFKFDKIYNLPYAYNVGEEITFSEFEEEAFRIAKKIKKWEVKYHKKTRIPVEYIRNIIFQYDKENHKWSYEL